MPRYHYHHHHYQHYHYRFIVEWTKKNDNAKLACSMAFQWSQVEHKCQPVDLATPINFEKLLQFKKGDRMAISRYFCGSNCKIVLKLARMRKQFQSELIKSGMRDLTRAIGIWMWIWMWIRIRIRLQADESNSIEHLCENRYTFHKQFNSRIEKN